MTDQDWIDWFVERHGATDRPLHELYDELRDLSHSARAEVLRRVSMARALVEHEQERDAVERVEAEREARAKQDQRRRELMGRRRASRRGINLD